ncbi:MAG TPA: glycosyltransferase family 4 protein [Vicinamibacterales bacterium]|jgi:glycosyltransferase involved in cell wall biosynthesis
MPALTLIVPGRLDTRTGGYGYDRRIVAGLRDRGWGVEVIGLADSFPFPSAEARSEAIRALASVPDGATVLIDGLALGVLPAEVEREAERLRITGLVHHPLAAEAGLDADAIATLERSERRALAAVRSVVVTSAATARSLAAYGVSADRVTVVEPGTDPAPVAHGGRTSEVALLCVATLTPRKGHELLLGALSSLAQRNWRLTCAGSVDRDPPTVERLRRQLDRSSIADRVEFVGDLDRPALDVCYDAADLFVLATLYEGYGMAVAEALARGVPIVSTATGAIEQLVNGGGSPAGVVLPPGDERQFGDALARVIGDADYRARLAEGARRARGRLPTWDAACDRMAAVLDASAGRA